MRQGIERAVDLIGRATSWIALAIVVLMATNVVLRYLFSYGTVWAQELEWHLLAPLILFGLPDQSSATVRYAVEIPKLSSLILKHSLDAPLAGETVTWSYSMFFICSM